MCLSEDFDISKEPTTALIVDFKPVIITTNTNNAIKTINFLQKPVYRFDQMDVVYESYIDESLTECERKRSSCHEPLEFDKIT